VPILKTKDGTEESLFLSIGESSAGSDSLRKQRLTAGGVRLEHDFSRSML